MPLTRRLASALAICPAGHGNGLLAADVDHRRPDPLNRLDDRRFAQFRGGGRECEQQEAEPGHQTEPSGACGLVGHGKSIAGVELGVCLENLPSPFGRGAGGEGCFVQPRCSGRLSCTCPHPSPLPEGEGTNSRVRTAQDHPAHANATPKDRSARQNRRLDAQRYHPHILPRLTHEKAGRLARGGR